MDVTAAEIGVIAAHLGASVDNATRTMVDPSDHHVILQHTGGGCTFLYGSMCMIYEARRVHLDLDSSSHTLGSRMESVTRRTCYCPIVYNTLEGYKHRLGYHYRVVAG